MYKSVEIKGLRLFKKFKVDGLARINLFIGVNGVGKTTLLEALFLQQGPSNPQLPYYINSWRGMQDIGKVPEEIWGTLFNSLDLTTQIEIITTDKNRKKRIFSLEISDLGTTDSIVPKSSSEALSVRSLAISERALLMRYYENGKSAPTARAFLIPEPIRGETAIRGEIIKKIERPLSHFSSPHTHPKIIQLYSDMEKSKREKEIINYLRIIEPRLNYLRVGASSAGPVLQGDIGEDKLLPIHAMGEGFNKVLGIILAIQNSTDGIFLIDEIENGIYQKYMSEVWSIIHELAVKYNVQIFATTHSDECIRSAWNTFSKVAVPDFNLYRLQRKAETVEVVDYDLETLGAALEMNLEIR